jgi:hypothetical protein
MTDAHPRRGGDGGGASSPTESVAEQARQAAAAAADHARDVASEARSRAASLADMAKEQATSLGDSQKGRAADALESVAKAIHKSGAQLEGDQDWAARLVEKGAAELESLATTLRRNDVQGLLDKLSGLARRQPAMFVGASMAAGFLLTRVGRLAAESAASAGSPPSDTTSAPAQASAPVAAPATPTNQPEARNGQF